MAIWKGHRYQLKTKSGETVAESRYFNMLLYLWQNMKDRENLDFIDTSLRRIYTTKELEKEYMVDKYPTLRS